MHLLMEAREELKWFSSPENIHLSVAVRSSGRGQRRTVRCLVSRAQSPAVCGTSPVGCDLGQTATLSRRSSK